MFSGNRKRVHWEQMGQYADSVFAVFVSDTKMILGYGFGTPLMQ